MNPINYARGLVDEFDGTQRSGDKEREALVRESLAWIAGELEQVDGASLTDGVRELYEGAKQAVADALASKPKRAAKAAATDA